VTAEVRVTIPKDIEQVLIHISDAFAILDCEWRYTFVNDKLAELAGMNKEDFLGRSIWELFPETVNSQLYTELHHALAEQVTVDFEYLHPKWHRWLENRVYPSENGISILIKDITQRKRSQQLLADKQTESLLEESEEKYRWICETDINEYKRADENLRHSEARYRSLAEASAAIVWAAAPWGNVIDDIPTWQAFTGQSPEQYKGWGWVDAVYPEDRKSIVAIWNQAFPTRSVAVAEYRVRRHDGEYRYMNIRGVPILEETGEIREWVGMCVDITERKQVEDRQRFLAQASSILASSLDYETTLSGLARLVVPEIADWCLVDIIDNQSVRRVGAAHTDPAKQELLQQLQNYPPDLVQPEGIAEVLRSGKSQITHHISDEQMQAATHNATHLKVLQELAPKSGMAVPLIVRGRVLGAITLVSSSGCRYDNNSLMLVEDLAGRAAVAVDNARLYTEAQRSQSRTARLQAITAALSESLTSTQVAEVIVDQGMAALGASSALVALVTNSGTDLEIIRAVGYQQELIESWRQFSINAPVPLAEAVRTGEPIWQQPTKTRTAHFSSLAQIYAQYNYGAGISIPLMLEGRAVGGMSLAFAETQEFSQDDRAFMLSLAQQCAQALERARLYEAEQTAREAAETANRIKDEFLAVLSHELRSPLNPILGWSKLLQTKKLDQKTIPLALKTIERNAKLQAQLIEDLLDISRILQGKLSLNICPVDLISVISGAMETVRLSADAKSIEIHTILEPNIGQVLGDSSRLQQIVWNLLSNAVKFTPEGGQVDIRLSKELRKQQESHRIILFPNPPWPTPYAQIIVSDTGKGIHPNFLPYVFDYFRQENSTTTRKFGGLGLGLAIVRHLVELHGGTVQVESQEENQGATFTVQLPLIPNLPAIKQDISESEPSADLNGIKILIVDDDADTREFIAFLLEQYGANVTVVTSANEALAALTESVPDVLLSDIGMPEMDGCMLIRQVRTLSPEQGGQIPAIALTAYAGQINEKQILTAGFHKHIAKPVEPAELVEAIASLIV
jgi:PAS domain S-box-containing protein